MGEPPSRPAAHTTIFEPNSGYPNVGTRPKRLGAGIHEVPVAPMPGGRLFVAVDEYGTAVGWATVEPGGNWPRAVRRLRDTLRSGPAAGLRLVV